MRYIEILAGHPLIIVASAPSLTLSQVREIGMARGRGVFRVMAINDAGYPCSFADILHSSDEPWWRGHHGMPTFPGFKSSISKTHFPDVFTFENTGTTGYDPRPGKLRSGGLSGYQAVHIAAQAGVKRVILVGFDMRGSHFFGSHPANIPSPTPNWDNRLRDFVNLAEAIKPLGMEIVNASPGTGLGIWAYGPLDVTIRRMEHARD